MFRKMKKIKKIFLFNGIFLAQTTNLGGKDNKKSTSLYQELFGELNPIAQTSAVGVVNSIINYAMYIAIPLSIIFIIYGGFQILFAKDDSKKVADGGKIVFWSVIGLAVVLTSKGIALIALQILRAGK